MGQDEGRVEPLILQQVRVTFWRGFHWWLVIILTHPPPVKFSVNISLFILSHLGEDDVRQCHASPLLMADIDDIKT